MDFDFKQLGAFTFISFLKHTFQPVDPREFASMTQMPRELLGDWASVDQRDRDLFNEMTESERKAMILRQATDLHESHHFHSFLLVPAGEILLILLMLRLRDATDSFDSLRTRLQAGGEPFDEPILIPVNHRIDFLLSYYLDGRIAAPIVSEEQFGIYPSGFAVRYDTGPKGSVAPAIYLNGKSYLIGLRPILESWTEALIRALVFNCRPSEYYDWYRSLRVTEDLWIYNFVPRVLNDIFGAAYSTLNPREQYTLIAYVSIAACDVLIPNKADFMEHQGNHPGWNFLKICGFLWSNREHFARDGHLDVSSVVRIGQRFQVIEKSIGGSSLVDHFLHVSSELLTPAPETPYLNQVFMREYSSYRSSVMSLYLQHRDAFYNAPEWLNCAQRDLLPRVPIMLSIRDHREPTVLNFPGERNSEFWFTWFLLSQLLESIVAGRPACPIVKHNVAAQCPRDQSCDSLRLITKDDRCYLRQLLSTKDPETKT